MIRYMNINESELDVPIYRVISVERFFELFKTNINTLVAPTLWEDPFEYFLSKTEITIDGKRKWMNPRVWGQCWTTRIRKTDAMWRIYTPFKNGVKIRTTPRKLIESFMQSKQIKDLSIKAEVNNEQRLPINPIEEELTLYCGRIEYLPVKKIIDTEFLRNLLQDKNKNILFVKRLEFKHESEFRLVFEHLAHYLMSFDESLFSYRFDFIKNIDEIVFDPRMDKTLVEAYSQYIKSQGYTGTASQSSLYSLPTNKFNL